MSNEAIIEQRSEGTPAPSNPLVRYDQIHSDEDKLFYELVGSILLLILEGETGQATDLIGKLFRQRENAPEGFFLLGLVSWRLGDLGQSIKFLSTSHDLAPDCRDYSDALASIHTQVGNLSDGLYFAKLSTTLDPYEYISPFLPVDLANYLLALSSTAPSAHYVNGIVRYNQRLFEAAAVECEAELSLDSNHSECLKLYGKCLLELGRFDEALIASQKATKINPQDTEALVDMGNALYKLGLFKEAVETHLAALESNPTIEASSAVADKTQYLDLEFETQKTKLVTYLNEAYDNIILGPNRAPRGEKSDADVIHVGYIVNSVYQGDTYPFFEPIFRHHSRAKFKVFVYQQSVTQDSFFTNLKKYSDTIRVVYDIDPETLSVILTNDRLDVLVDLSGYSNGYQYEVIKSGVVPINIGHLQFPFGLNSPGTNFVISDEITKDMDSRNLPEGTKEVVMDQGLFALDPFTSLPDPSASPALESSFVTFGSHCDLAILTPRVVNLWSEVLRSVPNSRLILRSKTKVFSYMNVKITELFDAENMGDRVKIMEPENISLSTDVSFYNSIDIFLDGILNFPARTIAESLWMGIPVLTLAGSERAELTTASILSSAEKAIWVSKSIDQYVKLATELSEDLEGLNKIRLSLRQDLLGSPLFDTVAYTRSWESALEACIKHSKNA